MARRRTQRFTQQDLTEQAQSTQYPQLNKAVQEYVAAGWRVFAINSLHAATIVCVSKTFGNVGGTRSAAIYPNGRFEPARGPRVTWRWSEVEASAALARKELQS